MSVQKILLSAALNPKSFSRFRFVEPKDAEFICKLRADPNLNKHINPSSDDVDKQREWIKSYKKREINGEEYYFVICHKKIDYGVVRMYDFHENSSSFSWGSWIIKPTRPAGLVTYSALMIYELGFETLGFEQAHFDVRNENINVINFHVRSGAVENGRTELDKFFIFPKEAWPSFKKNSSSQIKKHGSFRP